MHAIHAAIVGMDSVGTKPDRCTVPAVTPCPTIVTNVTQKMSRGSNFMLPSGFEFVICPVETRHVDSLRDAIDPMRFRPHFAIRVLPEQAFCPR